MKIEPMLHRILVKPDTLEDHDPVFAAAQKAGIQIAQVPEHMIEKNKVDTGTIISIGSTAFKDFTDKVPVNVGDRVVFARYSGKAIMDGETKFVLLNDEDIIARLGDKNDR